MFCSNVLWVLLEELRQDYDGKKAKKKQMHYSIIDVL